MWAVLREHLPPGVTVWVFGSRTDWTTKDSSDLDLALEGDDALDRKLLGRLRSAFEESDLPYVVDVVDMHGVSGRFKRIVRSQRVPLPTAAQKGMERGGWRAATIEDVTQRVAMGPFGSSIKVDTFVPEGVPVITGQHLRGSRVDDGPGFNFITHEHAQRLANSNVTRGDIVMTHRGTIGQVALVPETSQFDRYVVSQSQFYLRCDRSKVIPEFLTMYFRSPDGQQQLLANSSQVGVPSIAQPVTYVRQLEVPLPPLDEQRAIARVLGALDDKIELNRRMSATLEAMARALFKSWFVDFEPVRANASGRPSGLPPALDVLFPASFEASELGEIPAGWGVGTLGGLCEKPQYGYTQSARTEPIGPKFLRITDINKRAWVEWESVPHCEISTSDFVKYRLHDGDVLIARMADPGHGCMIEGDPQAVFASYLIRFRPLHQHYARFLQYWLRSGDYWELVSGRGAGTTRVSLNAKVLRGFPLVVPPDPFLEAFRSQVDGLRARVVANAEEARTLAAQRDTMLPRLVSGDVRVVDK